VKTPPTAIRFATNAANLWLIIHKCTTVNAFRKTATVTRLDRIAIDLDKSRHIWYNTDMKNANYRKINDRSHNSSTYHKKDGTPVRHRLKAELRKLIKDSCSCRR